MRNVIDETKWNTETDPLKRRALREAEVNRFFSSYPNVPHGGLKCYSEWMKERLDAGLSIDVNPPADVEPREAWRTRMIGTSDSSPGEHFSLPPVPPGGERLARVRALTASLEIKLPPASQSISFTGRVLHMLGRTAAPATVNSTSPSEPYGGERWMRTMALRESNAREIPGAARPSLVDRTVYRLQTLIS
jgi:hypothetical protein